MPIEIDWTAIGDGLRGAQAPVRLIVHPAQGNPELTAKVDELARQVEEAAEGGVRLEIGDGDGVPATPALTLATTDRAPIHYLGPPEGREAPPFVEALVGLSKLAAAGTDGLDETAPWAQKLKGLSAPAQLLLFVAPSCPHCPQAVSIANRIALACPQVTSTIVDVQRYEELAKRYNVQSVPRIVIDEGLSLTKVAPIGELVEHLLSRGTVGHAALAFDSLIETGRLAAAANELRGTTGPLLLAHAWQRSTTSSRMGLLLVVEELLDDDRTALDGAVANLLPSLQADDAALQGDTANLLGQIGHSSVTQAVELLLEHSNPDVAEIAKDALEQIRDRNAS